jgi:hypothetical protein
MREKLFKLFFGKERDLLKYYERQYQIISCSMSIDNFKSILPMSIQGCDIDYSECAYINKETGERIIGIIKYTNRTPEQNLASLYFKLKDEGYVD